MSDRVLLFQLTAAEIGVLCNGCGSQSGPFRFLRPPQGHAVGPCNQHDVDYISADISRWLADWSLLVSMLAQARERRLWQRPGFVAKAVSYWAGVRLGGHWSFHRGQPRTLEQVKAIAAERMRKAA